ncbi:OLC1v1030616C1 [Oldenlandia corymbosa var. corymbosa]|uniref:OLC1v1030616C1 n=1 Tax=Oldenlandia corymbosa var. corymbosa TaxID=529605 RepID=A0AAV1CH98_OLDCO|nr:OLC1v1030616C1 [Oldenlandia corymbosa var. corymbosa]
MNPRHVLIRFELEEDYQRCWITSLWTIGGYQMRILKWHPGFKFEEDPPIVPIWVSLYELPLEWMHPRVLFSIASAVEKPLQVDTPTLNLTRPSVARFCAEVDLTKELPKSIRIGKKGKKYEQYYTYECVPSYCSACSEKVNWGLRKGERKMDLEVQIINEDPFIIKGLIPKVVETQVAETLTSQPPEEAHAGGSTFGLTTKEKGSIPVDIVDSTPHDSGEVGSLAQTTQLVVLQDDVLNDCSEMNKTEPVMQANQFAILQSCDDNGDAIADIVQENADEDSDDVENDPKLFYPDDSLTADLLVSDDDDDAYEESWSERDKDMPDLAVNEQGELTTKKRRGRKTKDERAKLIAVQDYGAIDRFNRCIKENNLMEIPSVGDDFTWGGMRATGWVSKKLDRILFPPEWMDVFPKVSIELLSRTTSDYSLFLLQFDGQLESKPRSFRFQKMWPQRGDFKDLVQYNWLHPVWGSRMLAFSLKLRRLKLALKEWNKLHFGDVFQNLKLAEDKVKELEIAYDRSGHMNDRQNLSLARAHLLQKLKEHDDFWKQKLRLKWLKEGENNTAYFHASLAERKLKMGIQKIQTEEGCVLTKLEEIEKEAVDFFHNLLTEESPHLWQHQKQQVFLKNLNDDLSLEDKHMLEMEKRCQRFLWHGSNDKKRRHWRSWDRLALPISENGLGLRKFVDVVRGFSCKLWWKYKQQNGLWSHFILSLSHSARGKTSWSRVDKVDMEASQCLKVLVCEGDRSFWFDNWTSVGVIWREPNALPPSPQLSIKDFVANKEFYLHDLQYIPATQVTRSLKYTAETLETGRGSLIWQHSSSGLFTIKSAYLHLRIRGLEDSLSKNVWNKLIPLKISFFVWKLRNFLVPFPETLSKFEIQVLPSICLSCRDHGDSVLHCFLECTASKEIWKFFFSLFEIPWWDEVNLLPIIQEWWKRGCFSSARKSLIKIAPSFILWEIWKMRNKMLFDGEAFSFERVISTIKVDLYNVLVTHELKARTLDERDWIESIFGFQLQNVMVYRCIFVIWKASEHSGYVLNTDGSKIHLDSGYELCIRRNNGGFIYGESGFIGDGDSFGAEVYGVLFGARKCDQLGLQKVAVQTDNESLVHILGDMKHVPWKYYFQLMEIHHIIERQDYTIQRIFREANSVAGGLAGEASLEISTRYNSMSTLPRHIKGLVYCDDDDDSDTSDTEDTSKRKVRARYLTMSRRKKKEEKEKMKRMKMTQVTMGGVPLQTQSSQLIHVPEYSQDDLEEGDEDEEDEENEFDEDDVQDSVRMGAHHRDTPMYNLSSYPPPRYSSCPRPGPRGLPSPPTPIPSPMSGGGSQLRVSDEIDPTTWLVTDEVPGGPIDGSVIPSFLGHIANHFWHGYNRPTLKIFKGEKILNKLKMWYKDMDDVVRGKIRGTGLSHLLHTSYEDIDLGLVQAFVERWQLDTNSFHFPFGEMTIMMHDVYHILGIGVNEELVSATSKTDLLRRHAAVILGLDVNGYKWSHGGASDWFILERCQKADENTQASTFLWVLLVSTLFMAKSGGRCSVSLVHELMAGIEDMGSYSWGFATLAFLYRQLGMASREKCTQPRVHDWIPPSFPGPTSVRDRLRQVREHLDCFTELEVKQYSHPFLLPTTDPSAWMNELRKLTRDLIRKVKVSDRDLADEYDEKLQDTMIRYYKAP